MEEKNEATLRVNMFDPTSEIKKLCLEKEQREAYYNWFHN
jgi:hypothetical protein